MFAPLPSTFVIFSLVLSAAAHHDTRHLHDRASPPGTWYHSREHPSHALFKRGVGADGATYPDIGSPEWLAKYPNGPLDASKSPAEWKNALQAAVKAGKIPNIPQTTAKLTGEDIKYPAGTDGGSPEVCSTTAKCLNKRAIWDAPPNTFGTGFDDGPLPHTIKLLDFLKSKGEKATHFMIGITMVQNIEPLKATIASGNDLAVHAYNHWPMTSLSNDDIVAQLGWTMQIIHDSSGGKVPKYWRPPYGDSDNRVLALASEVFGLTAILWNKDTNDWGLSTGQTKKDAFMSSYMSWLTGPKTPGLIVLEHELSPDSVQGFIDIYPAIKANGWKTASVATLVDAKQNAYFNVDGDKVSAAGIVHAASSPNGNSNAPNNSTATSTPSTPSKSGSAPNATTDGKTTPSPTPTGAATALTAQVGLILLPILCAMSLI